MKPRIADLFCGAGGAGMGLHRAGFEVVGFDINPQPRYPFEFHQADALSVDPSGFDAVWASPPCQDYSNAIRHLAGPGKYPRLIEATVAHIDGKPFILENVPGAPLPFQSTLFGEHGLMLCGSMFGLRVRRHRLFLSNVPLIRPPTDCCHIRPPLNPYNANARRRDGIQHNATMHYATAMGIDWMKGNEIGEAIPPAYSEFLGHQLRAHMETQS